MRRLRSALNILLGLSEHPVTGPRFKVECRPEAWRCSVCGGGLVSGPPGKPLIHMHTHPVSCQGKPVRLAVRYVGVRHHAARVWASLCDNRPRLVRGQRRAAGDVSSGQLPRWANRTEELNGTNRSSRR